MSDPLEPLRNELGKIAGQSAERQDKLFNRLEEMLEKYPDRGREYIDSLIANSRQEQRLRSTAIILVLVIIAAGALGLLNSQFSWFGDVSTDDAGKVLASSGQLVSLSLDSGQRVSMIVSDTPYTIGRIDPAPSLQFRSYPQTSSSGAGAMRSNWLAELVTSTTHPSAMSFPISTTAQIYRLEQEEPPYLFKRRLSFKNQKHMALVIDSLDRSDTSTAMYAVSFVNTAGGAEVKIGPYLVKRTPNGVPRDKEIMEPFILDHPDLDRPYMAIISAGRIGYNDVERLYQTWGLSAYLISFDVEDRK